jgi:hypothetical protein
VHAPCSGEHGHEFPVVLDKDGVEHVTLVALCEPLGLKVDAQRRRVSETGWGRLLKIGSVRSNGKKALFWCLPLRRVPMFFATLSPGHVPEEVRPALIAMQNESADAIADYYLHGGAVRPSALPAQLLDLHAKIEEILRETPLDDAIWPPAFVKRYEAWHGRVWRKGDRPPYSMKAANWFFYEMIFPPEVLAVIRTRGLKEGCRYHQVLTDGPRDYLQRELRIATVLAGECSSETEWRHRMRRAYGKTKSDLAGQRTLDL